MENKLKKKSILRDKKDKPTNKIEGASSSDENKYSPKYVDSDDNDLNLVINQELYDA